MALAYLGFDAITGKISSLIKKNAEMSDSFADVQKTTGLTEAEVRKLDKTLKNYDTRTARAELLMLARDAGKLGITGKNEIEEFVKAADKINVALGEDLGKDAIKQIGKLVNVFQLKEEFGLEQSMIKVASAINDLGMSSEASEGFLVNFLNRMGGIAPLANISIDQTLALGATLDALGQTAEVSSTALSKMFVKMASEADKYAKIAGVSTDEFKKKMDENALEAFMMVLEAAGKTEGGIIKLVETLGDLGIEGGRATGVFGALAQNTEMLKKQMDIASKGFKDGTSVLDEFNTKNTNLAANVEKLQKYFANLFTNGAIASGIKNMVNYFAGFLPAAESSIKTTQRLTNEINAQLQILHAGNFSQGERKRLIGEVNKAYGEYLPNLIDEQATLRDIINLQRQFNSNMTTKMNMMRYEEEMALILQRQHAAAEMLYQIEQQRMKNRQDNFDPALFQALEDQLDAQEQAALKVLGGTKNQIEALKQKFVSIQQFIGEVTDEVKNIANGGGGGGAQNYDQTIAQLKKLYDVDLYMLKSQLADKLITKQEYDAQVVELDFKHINDRLSAAKLYNAESSAIEMELVDFRIKRMNEDAKLEAENKKLAFEAIKNALAEEEALIHENYANRIIDEWHYEKQLQEFKIGSLEIMKAAHEAYGDAVIDIEKKIAEAKAKFEKLKQGYASKSLLTEKELAEEKGKVLQQISIVQQENLTDMLAASRGFFKENSMLAKAALVATKAAAIAEIVIKAQIEKAAVRLASLPLDPTGLLGNVRAQLVNARMGASIAIIGAQTIQEIQGFKEGGHTGAGFGRPDKSGAKVAGVVHENEYVVPQWMLREPQYANVVNWLEKERTGQQGYFNGGFAGNAQNILNSFIRATNPATYNVMKAINSIKSHRETKEDSSNKDPMEKVLEELKHISEAIEKGFAIGDDQIYQIKERTDKLDKYESNARFK
ncbi:MAG: phage tail tape measure protein [Sphingobacteriaceae bacterium]|nr:phage tail tape measure protein [Sphingobacteriaceae bacterium]